jgi:hypothetical protein
VSTEPQTRIWYLRGPESTMNGTYDLYEMSGKLIHSNEACCLNHVMASIHTMLVLQDIVGFDHTFAAHGQLCVIFLGPRDIPSRVPRQIEMWLRREYN